MNSSAAPPLDRLPVFNYVIEPMAPNRIGRRWRWMLFEGDRLLAAGWRLGERHALRALVTAAARAAHEAAGLRALRPDRVWPAAPIRSGVTLRLQAGPVSCVLAPQ